MSNFNVSNFTYFKDDHAVSMTLRDYFAAQAMQGFIAYANHKGINMPSDDELAGAAYQLADAMLKAREA